MFGYLVGKINVVHLKSSRSALSCANINDFDDKLQTVYNYSSIIITIVVTRLKRCSNNCDEKEDKFYYA